MAGGRPPTDPKVLDAALALVAAGASPEEAAERLRQKGKTISARTIHRARAAPPPPAPSSAPRPARADAEAAVPRPPSAPSKAPPGLAGVALDLWILDGEIEETRKLLRRGRRRARLGGTSHGLAALGKSLTDLLKRRAELRPPPPPSADEEERRWRADADAVIRLIEAGVLEAEAKLGRAA